MNTVTSSFDTKDEMIGYFVDLVSTTAHGAVLERGRAAIALSGGSTPEAFYTALAARRDFPWTGTHFFEVDERFVPAGHKDNNFVMIERAFSAVPDASKHFHPVNTALGSAATAAADYNTKLTAFFGHGGTSATATPKAVIENHPLPRFDLIVLGMGKDGHTASLFPGTGAADVSGPLAIAVKPLDAPHERVSLTLPVLNAARRCIFIMFGADKRDIYARVRSGPDKDFPASLVAPVEGTLEFLVSADIVK